jgi:S-adenosylmethionine/arginine decarboxylase-like enzyme
LRGYKLIHHEHIVLRAEVNKPPRDTAFVDIWLRSLVEVLGMKILMGPYAVYSEMSGNRGLTAACIIETSHIVLHAWDEELPGMLQLDVYSCSEVDPQLILNAIKVFEPTHVDYKFLNRKDKFIKLIENLS